VTARDFLEREREEYSNDGGWDSVQVTTAMNQVDGKNLDADIKYCKMSELREVRSQSGCATTSEPTAEEPDIPTYLPTLHLATSPTTTRARG
jgi:hypothetical protein